MSRSSLSSWRAPRRPEAKGMYLGIAAIMVFLLSLPLVACGNKPVMTRPTPTATATQTSTPRATATTRPTPTATPTPLVDDYNKNFYTSHNPDLTDKGLEVFGTLSTDKRSMDLFNGGNKPINWKITSIDSQNGWLSADPLSGTAQAQPSRDNFITLTASNSQANLPPGSSSSYKATISFKPVNPNEPKPITVPLTVHPLPKFSTLTAPVPVPAGTTITITGDGSFTDLEMIAGISFGSAKVSSSSFMSQSSSEIILAPPPAENPGTVPITITVNRHDGSFMSFILPDQFTYTSTATATPSPTPSPTPTQPPTSGIANIHTRGAR